MGFVRFKVLDDGDDAVIAGRATLAACSEGPSVDDNRRVLGAGQRPSPLLASSSSSAKAWATRRSPRDSSSHPGPSKLT